MMDVVRFVAHADPHPTPRLGAPLPGRGRLVDLQAAHFAMTGAPSPSLRDPDALRARADAAELVGKVVTWAAEEDAPGTTVPESAVRVLEAFQV